MPLMSKHHVQCPVAPIICRFHIAILHAETMLIPDLNNNNKNNNKCHVRFLECHLIDFLFGIAASIDGTPHHITSNSYGSFTAHIFCSRMTRSASHFVKIYTQRIYMHVWCHLNACDRACRPTYICKLYIRYNM